MLNKSELQRSHAEGFGSSDAKMFRHIVDGKTLTYKERERIRVALGVEKDTRANVQTPATLKGHAFECWVADVIRLNPYGRNADAEVLLEKKIANNFRTFAHADWYDATTGTVFECKCTDDDEIGDVAMYYQAQLQWYFMLGARKVVLVWHDSKYFDFSNEAVQMLEIERNEEYVADLQAAVEALDERAEDYRGESGVMTAATASAAVATAVSTLELTLMQIKDLEAQASECKATLLSAMEAAGVLRIEFPTLTVTYVAPTVARTFDKHALAKAHPEIDLKQFEKTSDRAASLRITTKNA